MSNYCWLLLFPFFFPDSFFVDHSLLVILAVHGILDILVCYISVVSGDFFIDLLIVHIRKKHCLKYYMCILYVHFKYMCIIICADLSACCWTVIVKKSTGVDCAQGNSSVVIYTKKKLLKMEPDMKGDLIVKWKPERAIADSFMIDLCCYEFSHPCSFPPCFMVVSASIFNLFSCSELL